MIKTKIIGLVVSATIVGGGIGAALVSKINNNTMVATTAISQESGQVDHATGLMNLAVTKVDNLNVKANNLKGQLDSATQIVNQLQSQNNELNAQVSGLKKDIDGIKSSLDKSTGDNKKLTKQLDSATAKVDSLNSVIESNNKLIASQKHDIEQKNLALQDYIGLYQTEKTKHESDNKSNKNKIDELSGNAKEDAATIQALDNQVTGLESSYTEASNRLNAEHKENVDLKDQLNKEKSKNESSSADIKKVEVAVDGQTSAIATATAKAKKNDDSFNSASENLTLALSK